MNDPTIGPDGEPFRHSVFPAVDRQGGVIWRDRDGRVITWPRKLRREDHHGDAD